jgi:hypothetical protein
VQTQDRTQRNFLKKRGALGGIKPQGGNVQLSIHGDKVDEELKNNRLMPFFRQSGFGKMFESGY